MPPDDVVPDDKWKSEIILNNYYKKKRASAHFRENPRFFANLGASPEFSPFLRPPKLADLSPQSQWPAPSTGEAGSPAALITSGAGAGNGIRTRDTKLGKLVLYQLSYARYNFFCNQYAGDCQVHFRAYQLPAAAGKRQHR
jgi:hypothetical protein